MTMRKFVGGAALAVSTVAYVCSAQAADLPMRPAPMPQAPVVYAPQAYNWTGFYIGGNIGYGVARDGGTDTYLFPNGTPAASETMTQAPAGAVGGGARRGRSGISPLAIVSCSRAWSLAWTF